MKDGFSLLAIVTLASVFPFSPLAAATPIEVLLSEAPKDIILPNPPSSGDRNFTSWRLGDFPGSPDRSTVTYFSSPNSFFQLVANGYFTSNPVDAMTEYRPTLKFIEDTKPDEISGGEWRFSYSAFLEYRGVFRDYVAVWTWTEDATPPIINPGFSHRDNLNQNLILNRLAIRSIRRQKSRNAVALLERQQNLLNLGLNQSE